MQFQDDIAYLIAIFRLKDPKKQFGTELIESVTGMVIRHRENEQTSPWLHHTHTVRDGDRKVEDMLQRSAVDHHIKLIVQVWTDRLIHIVDQVTTFVARIVHRLDLLGAKELAEQLVDEPFLRESVLVNRKLIVGRQTMDLRR